MSGAVLADTGPLYAALDPTDGNHDRAQRDIGRLNEEGLGVMVVYPTLCEGYSLVLYKLGLARAHAWLEEIRGHAALLNPSPEGYRGAADRMLAYRDQKLSMFDALAAVVSEQRSLAVWTYDHHFDIMGVEVWSGA